LAAESYLRSVGLLLIALALALSACFVYLFLFPPSLAWRPLGPRSLVLLSVLGLSIVLTVVGLSLIRQGAATRA
jgi:hypothetical protein